MPLPCSGALTGVVATGGFEPVAEGTASVTCSINWATGLLFVTFLWFLQCFLPMMHCTASWSSNFTSCVGFVTSLKQQYGNMSVSHAEHKQEVACPASLTLRQTPERWWSRNLCTILLFFDKVLSEKTYKHIQQQRWILYRTRRPRRYKAE